MQLGLIGLGRMGGNMRERLRGAGHEVIGYDRNPDVSDVPTLDAMVEAVAAPRVVWVMVPSGDPTRDTVARLAELLEADDLVIDGGNSRFTDDFENAKLLADKGIGYVDCGVSGGVWGLENGYGLMCGGDDKWVERAMPIFDALRPEGPREEGFVHAGEVGAGHYAKMVHNGIEYGLMHAYAEGYELLEAKDIVTDVVGTFKAWSRGTVVRSWLLDLMVDALEESPISRTCPTTPMTRVRADGPSRRPSPWVSRCRSSRRPSSLASPLDRRRRPRCRRSPRCVASSAGTRS